MKTIKAISRISRISRIPKILSIKKLFFAIIFVVILCSQSESANADIDKRFMEMANQYTIYSDNEIQDIQKLLEEYYAYSEQEQTQIKHPEISERAWLDQTIGNDWVNIKEDLELRNIDRLALELVKEFQKAQNAATPTHGRNGSVHFTWSSYIPKILCRPMRVTDIILQSGEKVTGVHAGDTVRWTYSPGLSGNGENTTIHVMIKPLASDISTNLIIHTDRRVYNLDLVSTASDFFPSVSFGYPDEEFNKWNDFLAKMRANEKSTLNVTDTDKNNYVNPEDLNFSYEIRGKQLWTPMLAWDDGRQFYIQMPNNWNKSGMEAPVLIVYEHKRERIVNYRIKGDLIICDTLIKEKCALIAGTGTQQDRVVIIRKK